MAGVTWTLRALRNLAEIRSYIAQHDPDAARRIFGQLRAAGDSLEEFPRRGRPVGRRGRELVHVWPYVIRYTIRGHAVEILSIRHGRQRTPGR